MTNTNDNALRAPGWYCEECGCETMNLVSPDEVKAIKKFNDSNEFGFTLLADKDHKVSEKYGTWVEKSMYGKTYMGVQRATFIIGADGKIARVFPKVQPKTHDDVVLKALVEINTTT